MARFALVGSSYESVSPNIDTETCINLLLETADASANAKSAAALIGTPGFSLFTDLNGLVVRGQLEFNGRAFAVVDGNLWEIFAGGGASSLLRGTVANDAKPVSMVAGNSGNNQILIASAGIAYTFDMTTNAVSAVTALAGTAISQVDFCDGFYVALVKNSNQILASALLDATTWPGTSETQVSVYPDNVVGIKVMHREIYTMGLKASTCYLDAGLTQFPFSVDPSAGVIEQGLGAEFSTVILDNTLYWFGQDSRGGRMAWLMNGYTPERISTHALENRWNKYSTVSDAVAFGYQEEGHSFYVIRFGTANETWAYDVGEQRWHQRASWDGLNWNAQKVQNHMYAFGLHLVGDATSGKIYVQSLQNLGENGENIRRARRCPHISSEQQWLVYDQLQVDVETGLGPEPPLETPQGEPRGPIMWMRFSRDGGHTWSNWYAKDCGQAGQFKKRVIWRRMGRAMDMLFEIAMDDQVPWRIVDAYLKATSFEVPSDRLATSLRKIA